MSKEIDLSEYEGLGDLIFAFTRAEHKWMNSRDLRADKEYFDNLSAIKDKLNEFGNDLRKEINFDEQRSLITSMNKYQLDELIIEATRLKAKLEKPIELFIGIRSVLDVKNFNSTFCTDAYDDIKNVRDHRKLIKDDLIKEVLSLIVHPDNTITGRVICNPNWMESVLYPFVGR